METHNVAASVLAASAAYALAAGLLTLLPGPDTAIVITTAVRAGRLAALRAAFGIAVGLLAWGAAASLGIAAMLRSSAEVYLTFRIICAGYLFGLAVIGLRAAFRRRSTGSPAHAQEPTKRRFRVPWGFRQALLTALLNPKLGVFFVAFLPQFIPPDTSAIAMTLLFSAIQALEALLWFTLIGSLASLASRWLSRPRIRRTMDGVTGTVFLGFGARIALEP